MVKVHGSSKISNTYTAFSGPSYQRRSAESFAPRRYASRKAASIPQTGTLWKSSESLLRVTRVSMDKCLRAMSVSSFVKLFIAASFLEHDTHVVQPGYE